MEEQKEIQDTEKKEERKKLLKQIIRFGIVGGLSFLIDFVIYSVMVYGFDIDWLWAGFWGFTVSLVFNYLASMAFVFQRREDADRVKEFIVFVTLSLIGLGINQLILLGAKVVNDCFIVGQTNWFAALVGWVNGLIDAVMGWGLGLIGRDYTPIDWVPIEAKVIATGVVMVYNFITRKIFIEKKD